ncbi:carbon-nitrogen hydrolase family protein [Marinobacter nanhaiticus D15-8W]|uniref:Carbon-nitrogen hydrolase family protein n=1 Tax=Marinobacter nanhaiticus D15-8W TaxID=626887 RepID=N6W0A0_9GAMM|nr:carbon-nitrogen hydrolase family protein [Marinobacter nanhaiticus]ENO15955.1 carbon-nitrogen hydrolase family protein [Marinobacter nanhaiticus D15-8W]BES73187.1 carbon-nitrogen hydrolase family protein [Marinobacter nanhaiticus D15-8W]
MKLFAAQLRPVTGDIQANVARHLQFIEGAHDKGADLVFFPELSLTGFEPRLAEQLAMAVDDPRLAAFQNASGRLSMIIGIGLPLKADNAIQIGMLWFTPKQAVRRYAKQWLHRDEWPYFVAGEAQLLLSHGPERLAPAICYESMQPEHAIQAAILGATIYLASVAKDAELMTRAMSHYPQIPKEHGMPVVLSNALGPCDDFVCAGQSAAWSSEGELLVQMDDRREGGVLLDTASGEAFTHVFELAESS